MLRAPTASVVVLKIATPLVNATPLFRVVAPSRKLTVPVGVTPALPVAVAVKVKLLPATMLAVVGARGMALKMPAPVPVRLTVCVPVTSESVKTTVPVRGPVTVGVKLTGTVQLAPAASDVPQGLAGT